MALFPTCAEMDRTAFAALADEAARLQELAAATPFACLPQRGNVLRLLERVALIRNESPFPPGTLAPLASEEIVGINEQIAEGLGDALRFVPRAVLHDLAGHHQYDPGAIASECEVLFALHLMQAGLPFEEAGAQVERYALLAELWKTLRAEELRRLLANSLGVIIAIIVRDDPEVDEALELLIRRYLGGKIRRTFQAAVQLQPTVIDMTSPSAIRKEVREEVVGERNVAVIAALRPFRGMPSRDLYIGVMNLDRRFQYLPATIHRDAKDLLRRLRASRRTLAPDDTLESLDAELPDGDALVETIPASPESGGIEMIRAIELIRQHLGDNDARVIAEFCRPGPTDTVVGVAERLNIDERTVRRVFARLQGHPELLSALLERLRP